MIPPKGHSAAPGADPKANRRLIDTLRRSHLFRDYENVFTKATGLPLTLRPLEYWQLAHHGKKQENLFCALLAERAATRVVCLQAHECMIQHTGVLPHSVTCPFGLTETAIPVKLDQKTIGYLRIGQVLRQMPTKSDAAKITRTLADCGVHFTNEIRAAWDKNPLIPTAQYNAIVCLLTFFAEQLSTLARQILLEDENAEPLIVRKARAYITNNRGKALSLKEVAQASGAGAFYFCKVFKKTTGLRLSDYVSRLRLEDAKAGLLNPKRPVSAIAYDVGFGSLTQFNRVFKRIFGQSPTQFRAHLSSGQHPTRTG